MLEPINIRKCSFGPAPISPDVDHHWPVFPMLKNFPSTVRITPGSAENLFNLIPGDMGFYQERHSFSRKVSLILIYLKLGEKSFPSRDGYFCKYAYLH